jgi:putative restriction endonuclease
MNYWWVNQNQTFDQEFGGGYMWSPKTNKNGGFSQYYKNMTLVVPGDIVFSYKGQKIVAVGVVQSRGYSAPKPSEFGSTGENWSTDGWRVDVEYRVTRNQIAPKAYMNRLATLLPTMYSPIRADGGGNQVYLCGISKEFGDELFSIIGEEIPNISESEIDLELDELLAQKMLGEGVDKTEIEQVVKSRRGQGVFKSNLEQIEPCCRITKVKSRQHLIASHIKPWSKSNNSERLDGNNGLLLAPHIDHLFDKGYLSFEDGGDLIVSQMLDQETARHWNLDLSMNVGQFNNKQKEYLGYHRENVFKR